MIECQVCGGTGEILISQANNDGGRISDEVCDTCPGCNGLGVE